MSSKAGYLKTEKNMTSNIGNILQQVGQTGYDIMNTGVVKFGAGLGGKAIGSALIPVVGGTIGKYIADTGVNSAKYGFGLLGEVGQSIQDLQNGSSIGQEIKDVLNYIPNQVYNDVKDTFVNNNLVQVLKGDMNWRDGLLNEMESFAGLDWMSDKTHAWQDKQGNYHKKYVDGAKLVVGKWEQPTNSAPRPDVCSNEGILGTHNGKIYHKGFDDAAWAELQRQGKVK